MNPPATDAQLSPTETTDANGSIASIDPAGTPANVLDPGLAAAIDRASTGAIDQHIAQRKKRGPEKKPRKPRAPVQLDQLDQGPADSLLEEKQAIPLEGLFSPAPSFDVATAQQVCKITIGLLNDGAAAIVRAIAKHETGDQTLAKEAGESVRMTEKIEETANIGAVKCCEKYAVKMEYAPEFLLGGSLVIWGGGIYSTTKALKAQGEQLRQRAKEQKEAA
jgi:hypothetical protein